MIEKSPKNQADGKCSRTGPYPSPIGVAYARSVIAFCGPAGLQGSVEQVRGEGGEASNYMEKERISFAVTSILLNAKSFLPKSFMDAPK